MGVCVGLRGGRAALRVLLALRGRWAAVMHPAAARPCMHLHGWSSVAPVAGNVCVRLFGWPCKCGNCHGGEVAQQLPNLAPGITSQDERESAFVLCSWICGMGSCVSTDATATALPAPMPLIISAIDVIIRRSAPGVLPSQGGLAYGGWKVDLRCPPCHACTQHTIFAMHHVIEAARSLGISIHCHARAGAQWGERRGRST